MLFKKTTAMYCENHTKDMNAVYGGGGNSVILNVKSVGGLKPISERINPLNTELNPICQ